MRVLYFGHYDRDYSRNRIIRQLLASKGHEVIEAHDKTPRLPGRFRSLRRQLVELRERPDVIIVGFPGNSDMPMARALASRWRIPLIFDAFISQFDTHVRDRRDTPLLSPKAAFFYLLDWGACSMATAILTDTTENAEYLTRMLGTPPAKIVPIQVTTDEKVMTPLVVGEHDGIRIGAYTSFMPLHGTSIIVRATRMLADLGVRVECSLVGTGPDLIDTKRLAAQIGAPVNFLPPATYGDLPRFLCTQDVCLGIFGITPKANRVIPNKVVDALALGRPVITADTVAIRRLLRPWVDIATCAPGDPAALTSGLLRIYQDKHTRESLSVAARRAYLRHFSNEIVSDELDNVLTRVVRGER